MPDLETIRRDAIRYLLAMRLGEGFDFRFSPSSQPNLIGSSLAAMLGGLTGWIGTFEPRHVN